MQVKYEPLDRADGDPQAWEIDLRRMRVSEAEQLERASGMTKDEFDVAVLAGNSKARRVLLWHLMKRAHPRLPLRDVPDFYFDELELELSIPELERYRGQIEKAPTLSDAERIDMLDAIEIQIAGLRKAAGEVDGEIADGNVIDGSFVESEGKALSTTKKRPTG